jgi:hypothetical protein
MQPRQLLIILADMDVCESYMAATIGIEPVNKGFADRLASVPLNATE